MTQIVTEKTWLYITVHVPKKRGFVPLNNLSVSHCSALKCSERSGWRTHRGHGPSISIAEQILRSVMRARRPTVSSFTAVTDVNGCFSSWL